MSSLWHITTVEALSNHSVFYSKKKIVWLTTTEISNPFLEWHNTSIRGPCIYSARYSNLSYYIIVEDFYRTHGCHHRHQTPPRHFDSPLNANAIISRWIYFQNLRLVSTLLHSRIFRYSRLFPAIVAGYQFIIRMQQRNIRTTVIQKPLAGKEKIYIQ